MTKSSLPSQSATYSSGSKVRRADSSNVSLYVPQGALGVSTMAMSLGYSGLAGKVSGEAFKVVPRVPVSQAGLWPILTTLKKKVIDLRKFGMVLLGSISNRVGITISHGRSNAKVSFAWCPIATH